MSIVDEQTATVLEGRRGGDHDRDGGAAEQPSRPVVTRPSRNTPRCPESAVGADRRVVDEPKHREAEHPQAPRCADVRPISRRLRAPVRARLRRRAS
jgi:hypothetical protein